MEKPRANILSMLAETWYMFIDRSEAFQERLYLKVMKRPRASQLQRERIEREVQELINQPVGKREPGDYISVSGLQTTRNTDDPDAPGPR